MNQTKTTKRHLKLRPWNITGHVKLGNLEAVKQAIDDHKCNAFRIRKKDGSTLLHIATEHNQTEMVSLLLSRGLDFTKMNIHKKSPFYLACCLGHSEIAQIFLDYGAAKGGNKYLCFGYWSTYNDIHNTSYNQVLSKISRTVSNKGYPKILKLLHVNKFISFDQVCEKLVSHDNIDCIWNFFQHPINNLVLQHHEKYKLFELLTNSWIWTPSKQNEGIWKRKIMTEKWIDLCMTFKINYCNQDNTFTIFAKNMFEMHKKSCKTKYDILVTKFILISDIVDIIHGYL